MNGRPLKLAVADSPLTPLDERIFRQLEQRGRVKPRLLRAPDFAGIAAGNSDALFVPETATASLRRLLRRCHRNLPVLLGSGPLPRFRRRGVLRNADLFFYANTEARAERLRAGIGPGRLFFLPPYPLELETPDEERDNELRARALRTAFGIPDGERVLLFAGEFIADNAPGILLESFLLRLREGGLAGWMLALAGSGPLEGMLRSLAGESPRIRFLPPVENAAVLYRIGDLTALPAKSPRTGERAAAVAEALAASRPVLVTENAGEALALVSPGETGWSVDSAHPELWFEYPGHVPQERLRRMGEAAREAAATWSVEAAAAAIERALEAIPDFFCGNGG